MWVWQVHFGLLPDAVLHVPLALLQKIPLRVHSALFQDLLLQPMLVGPQGSYLSLLPVTLPLCLLLSSSQPTPGLTKLLHQTRAPRAAQWCSFACHLLLFVVLLDHTFQPADLLHTQKSLAKRTISYTDIKSYLQFLLTSALVSFSFVLSSSFSLSRLLRNSSAARLSSSKRAHTFKYIWP